MPLSAQQLAAQKNLSYVLAEKLAQRILKGEYEPGTILPGEIELGEQFGVSRTAVREAVQNVNGKRDGFYRDRELVPESCHNRTGIFLIRNCLPGG
ncbi:GntR family transcriptional regulator [Escherichia coli]|uniref:GntR family transcriptional regulator n=1 Tax=Escherichia coli TaxID=562 RepID=A0A376WBK5_ECOLX|nr:GntR family transcriptional regulator [Escherichia coli]